MKMYWRHCQIYSVLDITQWLYLSHCKGSECKINFGEICCSYTVVVHCLSAERTDIFHPENLVTDAICCLHCIMLFLLVTDTSPKSVTSYC